MVVVAGVTVTGTSLITGPMPGLIWPEPAMKCGISCADCPLAIVRVDELEERLSRQIVACPPEGLLPGHRHVGRDERGQQGNAP